MVEMHLRTRLRRVPLVFLVFRLATLALEASPLAELEDSLQALYRENHDAVVRVKVALRATDEEGKERASLTVLSGFFIDEQGTVLTNALPEGDASRIYIEKDGRQYLALKLGTDRRTNISIIQTAKPPTSYKSVSLADAIEEAPLGSLAFAITSPLEFAPTPKFGLVSGRESQFSEIEFAFTYTRISIPSGPAEGGAPVFDRKGRLLGVTVATLPEVNSSYIVPAKPLRRIVKKLREQGVYKHADTHLRLEEKAMLLDAGNEVVIRSVEPGSQADKIGIKAGDVILSIDGQPAISLNQVRDQIFFSEQETFIELSLRRGDEPIDFALLLEPSD